MLEHGFRGGYVQTSSGTVHYRETGEGPAVILLHQGGSSSLEPVGVARELPGWRAVLPDLPGHGASAPLAAGSIELYAQAIVELVDHLGIDSFVLFGHHFGGVVAVEIAARLNHRVSHLVLSNTPFVDEDARSLRRVGPPRSFVANSADGSHLRQLWETRDTLLRGDVTLINRYIAENLLLGELVEIAHEAVATYRMEGRWGQYSGATTYIYGDDDPYAEAEVTKSVAGFTPEEVVTIPGGTVALVDQHPKKVAQSIIDARDRTAAKGSA